jgi:hypothetical protein
MQQVRSQTWSSTRQTEVQLGAALAKHGAALLSNRVQHPPEAGVQQVHAPARCSTLPTQVGTTAKQGATCAALSGKGAALS